MIAVRRLPDAELDSARQLIGGNLDGYHWPGPAADSEVLAAYDGDQLVACLHWCPVTAEWYGSRIRLGQTGPGATVAAFRGRRLMSALLRRALRHMRANGLFLAAQETPIVAYHNRYGWEVVSFERRHALPAGHLTQLRPTSVPPCHRVTPADATAVHEFWRAMIGQRPFTAHRDLDHWRSLLGDGRWFVATGRDQKITAYGHLDPAGAPGTVVLDEVVSTEPAATLAILSNAGAGARSRIEWWTPVEQEDALAPAVTSVEYDKLLRVVDAQGVLDGLARELRGDDELVVRIHDELCSWNGRTFRLTPGVKAHPCTGRQEPDVVLDARALAAIAGGRTDPDAGCRVAESLAAFRSWPAWYPDDL